MVEEHPMAGRGSIDAVQSASLARSNQGIEAANVRQRFPAKFLRLF